MTRPAGVALQVVLALLLLVLLVVQVVLLPAYAAESAGRFPEASFLQAPLLVLGVVVVACVQVAVICVMVLLVRVDQERIFEPAAVRQVDVFIGSTAVASVLVLSGGLVVSATVGSPAWVLGVLLALVGAGVALLMVQMRGLLRHAIAQHAELAEVV